MFQKLHCSFNVLHYSTGFYTVPYFFNSVCQGSSPRQTSLYHSLFVCPAIFYHLPIP
ncbi:hypothetical protein [Salmonella phage SD-1_S14]|nr:hypothetical protein [Salmonella phage SD-2_S15]WPK19424.1 hypothetical protein [Salmonella phage SD-6_S16]WPK20096.1 hypothetical protein [Salmonella phage SD-1_S14]WPK21109.1 hypothetical protein [Salmonella phage SD-15_S21]